MTFAAPLHLLWGLLILVALVLIYRAIERRTAGYAQTYTQLVFLDDIAAVPLRWQRLWQAALLAALLLLVFAAARPSLTLRLPAGAATVVLCIDTSGSMSSSDVAPTRAQAALVAIHRLVDRLDASVRVGLVSFSSEAQVLLRPTTDREAIGQAISEIPAPNGATAIGDAMALAETMMPMAGHHAIILITDGVNNRGADPLEISHELAEHRITLSAIGIGTSGSGQFVPGTDEAASVDPEALQTYAAATGGEALVAKDAERLAAGLSMLADAVVWEPRRIDLALPCALGGALLGSAMFLLGFAWGKYP